MNDYRKIYNIYTLSLECSENPEYMKSVWSRGIHKIIRRWKPIFKEGYTEEIMVDDVMRMCLMKENIQSAFWYIAPPNCSKNEVIRLTTIALFECLDYYFYYNAPCESIIDADTIKGILNYKLHIYWEKYNLTEYSFEQIKEVLAEGMKGKLCDWLGENRIISSDEWVFLRRGHFPFANPKQNSNNTEGLFSLFMPSCKMNELDYAPLYEHIDSYKSKWRCSTDEETRRLLFSQMDTHLWRIVTDASSYVWGG